MSRKSWFISVAMMVVAIIGIQVLSEESHYVLHVDELTDEIQIYPYENGYFESTSFVIRSKGESDPTMVFKVPLGVERYRVDFLSNNGAKLGGAINRVDEGFFYSTNYFFNTSKSILRINDVVIEGGSRTLSLNYSLANDPYLELVFPIDGSDKKEIEIEWKIFTLMFVAVFLTVIGMYFKRIRNPEVLALLLSVVFFTVTLLCFEVSFMTNDDVAMMLTANGFLNNFEPSEHLVFISLWIGKLLKNLYELYPAIQWYSYFLLWVHFLSCYTILYCLLSLSTKYRHYSWIILLVVAFFEIRFISSLTFTTTAFVSIIAGSLALIQFVNIKKIDKKLVVLASVCFVLGTMVRYWALVAVVVVSLPFLILNYKSLYLKRLVLFSALIAMCIFGLRQAESHFYSNNAEWGEFLQYNQIRGALHDTQRARLTEDMKREILPDLQWTDTNYTMFMGWFFVDKELYSEEKLSKFLSYVEWQKPLKADFSRLLTPFKYFQAQAIFFCVTFFLFLVSIQTKKALFNNTVQILYSIGLLAYLALFMRLPARVGEPIFLLTLILLVWNFLISQSMMGKKSLVGWFDIKKIVFIFPIALIISAGQLSSSNDTRKLHKDNLEKILGRLSKYNDDALYVNWGGRIPFQSIDPFIDGNDIPRVNILGLGWRTHSPNFDAVLNDFSIEILEQDLVNRNDILLICWPRHIVMLQKRIKEKWGRNIEGKIVYMDTLTGMPVYRIDQVFGNDQ